MNYERLNKVEAPAVAVAILGRLMQLPPFRAIAVDPGTLRASLKIV